MSNKIRIRIGDNLIFSEYFAKNEIYKLTKDKDGLLLSPLYFKMSIWIQEDTLKYISINLNSSKFYLNYM